MGSSVAAWSLSERHIEQNDIERWLGDRLRIVWDVVPNESLPAALAAAVAALERTDRRIARAKQLLSPELVALALQLWSTITCSGARKTRAHAMSPRLLQRAIREQGVSWLASEDDTP